jgi:hypothetical protein
MLHGHQGALMTIIENSDHIAGKICCACGDWKPLADYSRRMEHGVPTGDGYQNACKPCRSSAEMARYRAKGEVAKARLREQYAIHREKRLAEMRAYRSANRDKVLEQKRAHWAANRERINIRRRMQYAANPELQKVTERAYYIANREKRINYSRAYRRANPEIYSHCVSRATVGKVRNTSTIAQAGKRENKASLPLLLFACRS